MKNKYKLRYIIFSGIILLIMYLLINGKPFGVTALKGITDVRIPDMEITGYSTQYLYEQFEAMGQEGRDFYIKNIIPIDFIFPLSYMIFFSLCLSFVSKPSLKLYLIPVIAGLFDYTENIIILILLNSYPKELAVLSKVSSIITVFKWVLIFISVIVLITGILIRINKKRRFLNASSRL